MDGANPIREVLDDSAPRAVQVVSSATLDGGGDADVVIDLRGPDAIVRIPPAPLVDPPAVDSPGEVLHRIQRAFPAPIGDQRYERWKRRIDVAFALALLAVAWPILLALTVLIRLDSKGPAIYTQSRIGRGGQLFAFKKFRTMYTDARERFPELYRYHYSPQELDDLRFKTAVDPRHTRVGRWLRRTSLDELPNLINVLRGEMSLVGPRPEIPDMLPYYEPEELVKFAVPPGLTGYAQIRGRNVLRFKETLANDLEYVRDRGLKIDLAVLVRTPVTVTKMIGAL